MKMLPEHYAFLKSAILPFKHKITAHRAFIVKQGRSNDIEMRLRWDLFHAANIGAWYNANLDYLNDNHVDTALRSIMNEMEA